MIVEFYGTYISFFRAAILGIFFGMLYDAFRIIRISHLPYILPSGKFYELISIPQKEIPHNSFFGKSFFRLSGTVITFVEDLLFWIIASLCEILFIYHVNGGAIRIYFIFISLAASSIYFLTIGKLTIYFSVRIIFLIRCLLYWSFCIIIYPVRIILLIVKKILLSLASITVIPVVNSIKRNSARKYSQRRIHFILEQSKKGFFGYGNNKEEKYYS